MKKIKLSKFSIIFLSIAVFAIINEALVRFTLYRLYFFGLLGRDLVWLSIMALTALVVRKLLVSAVRSQFNGVLKLLLVTALCVAAWVVLQIELAALLFNSVSIGADRYEFTSPDGKRTALVYEASTTLFDIGVYAYEKKGPFVVRSLGGYNGSFDTAIAWYDMSERPRGEYFVDWSGGDPIVTPQK